MVTLRHDWEPSADERDPEALVTAPLVEECESFLHATWATGAQTAAPGRACLALLAYATPGEMRSLQRRAPELSVDTNEWLAALGVVADAFCAIADAGGPSIAAMQRRIRQLCELKAWRRANTPGGLVRIVAEGVGQTRE